MSEMNMNDGNPHMDAGMNDGVNGAPEQTLGAPANADQGTPNQQQGSQQQMPGQAEQGNQQQGNQQEMLGATQPQETGQGSNLQKDPDEWATGDEPMTEAQKSYLDTLAKEAGETLPATMTKAEASKHIDRLQGASGRVNDGGAPNA